MMQAARMAMGPVLRQTLLFDAPFWEGARLRTAGARPRKKSATLVSCLRARKRLRPGGRSGRRRRPCSPHGPRAQRQWRWQKKPLLSGGPRALLEEALRVLAKIFGLEAAAIKKMLVSWHTHDWQGDAYSRGAYSYAPCWCPGCLVADDAAGGNEPCIFAGEHTDTEGHWGTVHAALNSGFGRRTKYAACANLIACMRVPSGPAERCSLDARIGQIAEIRLKYRQLGSSKLLVSEIAFGSWLNFSDTFDKDNAIACVHRALDRGINLLDTANVYARGAAERLLGEALAGIKRDSFVLATKLYFPMSRTDRGLSRAQVFKQLDASLLRLNLEYVDLYQCHRYDADTPLEETMQALSEVVRAGKVRYIGFSEWPVDKIRAALAIPGVEKFVSSQPQYSLLHRDPEKAVIPLSSANGISQIVWSPLAQGILSGKYLPGGQTSRRQPRRQRCDQWFLQPGTAATRRARSRPIAAADCSQRGLDARPIRACLGAAATQRGVGNHRRDPS